MMIKFPHAQHDDTRLFEFRKPVRRILRKLSGERYRILARRNAISLHVPQYPITDDIQNKGELVVWPACRMAVGIQSPPESSDVSAPIKLQHEKDSSTATLPADSHTSTKKSVSFWLVLLALVITLSLAVLESYAVSTTLPVIVSDLKASQFIWVPTAYGIASTALLPLSGGLAQIFGRRPVMLGSISLFAIGSALGGASKNMTMFIVARIFQGAGGGGIYALTQIILSDLVTLAERGKYSGLMGMTWALSGGIGPVIGGALARHTVWRWLFYLNLPLAGVCLLLISAFLKVPTPAGTLSEKLARVDWIGNIIVITATTGCAIALTWGGVVYPWRSVAVLVPLCISATLLVVWLLYESRLASVPALPLFSNRTTFSGYMQIGFIAFIIANLIYYLPIYYQACKDASPTASGVDLLGLSFSTAPISIVAGISVSVTKRYRPQIWFSWFLTLVGIGLLSTLTENSSRAKSIGFQILTGSGIGILWSAVYFPVLAPLPVTSNAYALAGLVFLRTLFQVWGVTIGGAIIQNELQRRLPDSLLTSLALPPGESVAYTIIPLITALAQPDKDVIRKAFAESFVVLWRVLIVVGGIGLIVSALMRPVPLHSQKDKNWELKERSVKEVTSDA